MAQHTHSGTRCPIEEPPFTLATLRKAIPPHCFKRSLIRSFQYLAVDVAVAAALVYCTTLFENPTIPHWVANFVLWPAYWLMQGAVCTGIWVISHECGHGAFSDYPWVNDAVGLFFHSLLLVPYYSWKHSHRRHHSNTGSVDRDEVFVPTAQPEPLDEPTMWNHPFFRTAHIAFGVTLGWPLYLLLNIAGRPYDRWANHFDPYSPIFSKKERIEVAASDAALVCVLAGLYGLAMKLGWAWLTRVYVIPYLIVNFWLVMITWLQHTHPSLPHYNTQEWEWLRGALCTVDRSYGFLDHVFHHIADTHVVHHLFSSMPHYHAEEATRCVKPILGKYYLLDERNVFAALWQDVAVCNYVAPDTKGKGVLWYRP